MFDVCDVCDVSYDCFIFVMLRSSVVCDVLLLTFLMSLLFLMFGMFWCFVFLIRVFCVPMVSLP